MRLLYITDSLAIYGGLERVLTQKMNWFAENNYDVFVITVNQGDKPICFQLHPKVECKDLGILFYRQYDYSGLKRLVKRHELNSSFKKCLAESIRELSPNIIVCAYLGYVRHVLQVKGKIPLVFESHSSCLCESFENDGLLRRLYIHYLKCCLKRTDMVVALTYGDAHEWRKFTSRVCVIPNVVSLNTSNQLCDCSAKSVVFVGRYSKQKDLGSLLQIWSIVHSRYPEWQLHIYGGYGGEMNAWLTEIGLLDSNIVVHGADPDMINRYKEHSILLLTSKYEPFGLVLPEAMSCGLPVVSFDCPYGPLDIIADGIDGFLIRNRDINAFAEKLCLLIENHDLRIRMGKAGAVSSHRYDVGHIMPLWIKLFNQISNE